jgi:hypothetical protein
VFAGYLLGAILMLAAAAVMLRWGIAAERKPLEEVSRPLAAADCFVVNLARQLPDSGQTTLLPASRGVNVALRRRSATHHRGNTMAIITRREALSLSLLSTLAVAGSALPAQAKSGAQIDDEVRETLHQFDLHIRGSRELLAKSAAVLGVPVGDQGRNRHRRRVWRGRPARTRPDVRVLQHRICLGRFPARAQARSVIIVFMTEDALSSFRRVNGWKIGVDGSVALITVGVGGSIDTSKIVKPIVGFIFDNKGLMYNLTLEGSKISRISR